MEKEIIIASGNKGKIKEASEILDGYKIIPIKELGIDIDVEEDKARGFLVSVGGVTVVPKGAIL